MPGMATGTVDDAWLHDLLLHGSALGDPGVAQELAATLAARCPAVDGGGAATRALLAALAATWERGWQPADIVHRARREATAAAVPLAVALIGEHARVSDAESRAPVAWVEQLRDLGALPPGDPAVVATWHRAERRPAAEAWRIVLRLAGALRSAARIEVLGPPPPRRGAPLTPGAEEAGPRADRGGRPLPREPGEGAHTPIPPHARGP